jgi:hypothetical protein
MKSERQSGSNNGISFPFCGEEARHRVGGEIKKQRKKKRIAGESIKIFQMSQIGFRLFVFCPAFLSAFTSRYNDKGRLFDDRALRGRSYARLVIAGFSMKRNLAGNLFVSFWVRRKKRCWYYTGMN